MNRKCFWSNLYELEKIAIYSVKSSNSYFQKVKISVFCFHNFRNVFAEKKQVIITSWLIKSYWITIETESSKKVNKYLILY